ncbi:MAG TPA: D-alanyl-D-alanine carboxypeptidase/D-alanyl-D-alanine-endopeptidase [Burkholderiales bacterium]|nr:D-alanyl-D-alanine carboxypeptidase/D-alanyl-D-alanine-endopeptidase [Burkholderiales bacterium]
MWRVAIVVLLSGWCWQAPAAPVTGLPEPLARSLQRYNLSTAGLSVYIHEVGADSPLVRLAADEPRSPASVMKLLPTFAALEELGPAYQWRTELWSAAPLRDGRLEGDIYIKGYGDPYLVIEHFWRLLRLARQEGIAVIGGNLVLDQTYFAPDVDDAAEFDGRPHRAYNVLPTALLINFQAVNFRFIPDTIGKRVRVVAEPWPAHLVLENNLRLVQERCRGGWASTIGIRTVQKAKQETVVVSGTYNAECGEHDFFRVVSEPEPYVGGVFKSVWNEMGGRFEGSVRHGAVPEDARLIATIHSPPLADVVRSVNKFSNNVMTRQLLLTLGARQDAGPGTVRQGIDAVREWMKKRALDFPELVLENGTGLSRKERISARHLGELLLTAYDSPVMPEFLSSFPVSGLDGTMRHRLANTSLAGRVHVKTGSINNVHTIAGYVLDQFNRRVVVVVLHNHPQADTAGADAFQDAVLDWVYRRSGEVQNARRRDRN